MGGIKSGGDAKISGRVVEWTSGRGETKGDRAKVQRWEGEYTPSLFIPSHFSLGVVKRRITLPLS
jgi:hypothetical protein